MGKSLKREKISISEVKDLDNHVDDIGDENLVIFPAFTRVYLMRGKLE